MTSLFRNRFSRPVAPRRRRLRAAAPAVPFERLEPRLALAGDTFSRPMLERAATLVMDGSFVGPNPVVMSKSQVVGNEVKSFVISHVPEGSVVEKWDAATEKWIDVSTKPTSSNPQELMRLLGTRVIHQGDKIQWRPKAGFEGAVQQAFQMINWDDGSELLAVSAEAPSAVQNLAVNPTGVAELTVTWVAPATGDATSYSITMTTTSGTGSTSSNVYTTTNTSYKVSGLSSANAYSFKVTASNEEGTSLASTATFAQPAISVGVQPSALTTGLDGSIWVANFSSNTVQQITNSGGVWTAQPAIYLGKNPSAIKVSMNPWALTTGLDGSIWVANHNANNVQQITNSGGVWTVQHANSVGVQPSALTTGLDGSIWVANFSSNNVEQITNSGGVWTGNRVAIVGKWPTGLTTGLDGSIWVANERSNTVQQITQTGGVWTVQPAITVGTSPIALTTGLDGSIWVANQRANTVQQITNSGGVWTAQPAISVGKWPQALTTGLHGSIWVANIAANTVQQITNSGGVWTAQPAISVGVQPSALTTGLDGSIWVANSGSNTVQKILPLPNAPSDLAAVFGPGPGEMTLAWKPPVIDGGTPVISYTATVSQGTYAKTITTSDTSCVFDGLTLGSGPTYFTVTATNFAGESKTAGLQIDAYGNPIPAQNTGIGITTDGTVTSDGGFDGSGNTYSWTALGDTSSGGALVGSSLVSGGLAFDIGSPNQPNFVWAAGQDIEATGTGNVLTLVGATVDVDGWVPYTQFTLNFDDGTTATWTQELSDWCDPQYYDNESILSTQSYRNTASGGTDDTTNYIYSYGYTLPEGKTLASITLPNDSNFRFFGAALSDPTAVDLSDNWNAYGLVVPNNEVPNGQGFDGHGNYYSASTFGNQTASSTSQNTDDFAYRTITWGGATFNLGPAPNHYSQSNNLSGNDNFMQFAGQTIDLQSGDYSKILMIGAVANGNQNDQAITLTFADGSTAQWTQSFTDWANDNGNKNNSPPSGAELAATNETLVATTTWVNHYGHPQIGYNRFVYGYTYDIPAGKTLESITLPNNSNIGILGMALV